MKSIKHLAAFGAIAALSLVVACSNGNTSGMLPNSGSNAFLAGAFAPAAKSPIQLSIAKLDFTELGAKHAKTFTATEKKYEGEFTLHDTCLKHVTLAPDKAKGPAAKFKVTPVSNATCEITVTDFHKNKALLRVVIAAAKPTPSPSSSPAGIQNGNFATGSLSPGWHACTFAHSAYAAPVNPSPTPETTSAQASSTAAIAASLLAPLASVTSPPGQLNPNVSVAAPSLGKYVALAGSPSSQTTGVAGICQSFVVPSNDKYLSFWAWEGGSEYDFSYADQEADILDSKGSTIQQTLFAEENCFWDPGVVGLTGYPDSGCIPAQDGGTSSYKDWLNGGYWVQRGPYDLTAYAGQTVTLFIGAWDNDTHAGPTTYGNEIFVGNVQLTSSDAFPSSFAPEVNHT
jgi:hypothetical protein